MSEPPGYDRENMGSNRQLRAHHRGQKAEMKNSTKCRSLYHNEG
jgi:hypothetical protein